MIFYAIPVYGRNCDILPFQIQQEGSDMSEKELVKSVGKAIAKQRKSAGLTQSEVAAKLKVEKETVSRLETGAISPTLTRLHQMAELFGCPVRHFFWREEGTAREQAETMAEMLATLPADRRERLVRCVAELADALRE